MNMKILIVNKFLYPNGGSETYIFKLGRQLQEMGHEVQYFGMEHEGRIVGNRLEQYTSNMDFHSGKLQKLLYPFKIIYSKEAKAKMLKVLRDFEPDVVHLNNFNFQLTPSVIYAVKQYEKKCRKKVRLVYTAHDSQLVCPNHLMQNPITHKCCEACLTKGTGQCAKGKCIHGSRIKSILGTVESQLYKRLKTYKNLDAVICPSHFIKSRLDTDPVLREKTVVLRNFVEVPALIESVGKKDYVLYFGRYSEEKGIRTLQKVCRDLPDISFHFAGNGPLQEQIESVKNIRNLGFLTGEALAKEISEARFVVFPSECYENCPFTVMEAQLLGTPVIGSHLGGIPELIEEGVTGELFESGNCEMLTGKIRKLWEDSGLVRAYSVNCAKVSYDNIEEYVIKLLKIYQNKE